MTSKKVDSDPVIRYYSLYGKKLKSSFRLPMQELPAHDPDIIITTGRKLPKTLDHCPVPYGREWIAKADHHIVRFYDRDGHVFEFLLYKNGARITPPAPCSPAVSIMCSSGSSSAMPKASVDTASAVSTKTMYIRRPRCFLKMRKQFRMSVSMVTFWLRCTCHRQSGMTVFRFRDATRTWHTRWPVFVKSTSKIPEIKRDGADWMHKARSG